MERPRTRSRWSERMKRMSSTLPRLGQPSGIFSAPSGARGLAAEVSSGVRPLVAL